MSFFILRAGVEVGKRNVDIHTCNGQSCVIVRVFAKEPASVILSGIVLHAHPVLMYEQIFLECRDRAIELEFLAPVVGLGGGGQDFNKEERVDYDVAMIAVVLKGSADYRAVSIGVHTG